MHTDFSRIQTSPTLSRVVIEFAVCQKGFIFDGRHLLFQLLLIPFLVIYDQVPYLQVAILVVRDTFVNLTKDTAYTVHRKIQIFADNGNIYW